ncbi:MAG: Vacuolar protein sorting-associated protein 20 [Thelocarpon superellum]|nr:MAG: Vacuolar protein sorting-associated protein 20 [Thelocarpon superellum]
MGNTASHRKISAQDKAILDMKNQRDKLHQYQRKITVLTSRETAIAKTLLGQNNKQGALLALRRKKFQESLLAKTDAQLEQLEKLTASVEFAQVQKDVLFGLQQGTSVLNEIHREMGGIDQVEKLMGESEEARAYQREISEMLGGRISNQDEDEVEDELDALEEEVVGKKLPATPTTQDLEDLPAVPQQDEGTRDKAKVRQRTSLQAVPA